MQRDKQSTIPFPTSAAVKLPPESVLTCTFFAPLRTTAMDTETTSEQNVLSGQEALRKSGKPQPIIDDFYHKYHSNTKRIKIPHEKRLRVPKYLVCSKCFEIAPQLDVLAMLGKLCCLVACFLITILFAALSCCD
jgi:hypothetical protein